MPRAFNISKLKDKRVIYLSLQYKNEMGISVNRFRNHRNKPIPVIQYNGNTKEVAYYSCECKYLHLYKNIFIYILQMIVINGTSMYKKSVPLYEDTTI